MKTAYKKYLVLLVIIGVAFTGCNKFLNVNTDPNDVTSANITAPLIFTGAEVRVGNRSDGVNAAAAGTNGPLQFAYGWVGYMAYNGGFSRIQGETSYTLDNTFADPLWINYYSTLFDLYQAKEKGLQEKDTALAGAAMVLSAKLFQQLVDLFGNIPYSQAFQSDKYSKPAYDKAQDIYQDLQLSLDTAITYLNYPANGDFISSDVIARGNTAIWIKFANTLKLRLLIRQSEVPGFDPSAEIAKIVNNGGVLGAGQSISVNPGYVNEINKQSPFYANFGYTPLGALGSSSTNANAYIVNILSSTNDPRLAYFFAPLANSTTFLGCKYGDLPGNLPTSSASASYFGPGIINSATQNQWIMPSFESMFLYAEAVARGWFPNDHNAEADYQAAVTESFTWLGVPNAATAAANYMATDSIANWANAGTSAEQQAKFIVMQKYIANTCIDPLESYAD
ncbi:MAG: SusD/RagB family nutrient-binding outer membrane lipoprotein, partial [Chitinophagaceae bacterium]